MSKPAPTLKPPSGLSAEARALWQRTVAEYTFDSGADFALLGQMCEALDRLRQIQAEIRRTGLVVEGSTGQLRTSPMLAAEDACRRTILAHVRALRLSTTPEF